MNFQFSTFNFQNSNGFTLAEFLIVICIIGIISLIGIPAFRAYQPSLQLSGAVRDLVTDLRYAQQLAVTEQITYGIRFSTSTNQYQIIKIGTTEEILETKDLPEKVSFQEISFTDGKVKFNPYGAVKEAGSVTLINVKNVTTTIEVRPSGFVKIKR